MTQKRNTEPDARIAGRILRLAVGIVLTWLTYEVMRTENLAFNLRVVGVIVVLAAFYSAAHVIVDRRASNLNRWLGAALALVPVALVYALGGPVGRVATVAYIGISLVLQAARGDGGCEVMSIPAVLLGRRTHLMCLAFSPVDRAEAYLSARWKRRRP